MLASLLVSQATTHILIENDQITAFPSTNKWHCLARLAEDSWAGKPGTTAGVGHSTLRTHTRAHTHMLQARTVFPSSSVPSRMLLLTPGSCFPLSQVWFHLLPTHLTSGLWAWAAGQCHRDRSALSLTSTAALNSSDVQRMIKAPQCWVDQRFDSPLVKGHQEAEHVQSSKWSLLRANCSTWTPLQIIVFNYHLCTPSHATYWCKITTTLV